jgi:hypothetical protein
MEGDSEMGFFTNRERKAPGKTPRVSAAEQEFMRAPHEVPHDRKPLDRESGFANRERPGPNIPPRAFSGAREFVRPRQDVPTERRPVEDDPGSMLQSVTHAQVHEIDILIADLQRMRETLRSEAVRVQQVMVAYTTFSEKALQSSKVICESLRSGLRPLREKRQKEKGSSRARRKAARRLARMSARLESAKPESAKPVDSEKSVG